MKITLITVGSPKLSFAQDGIDEYFKRIQKFAKTQMVHIKEGKSMDKKILDAVGNSFCILMDEKGKDYSSMQLAAFLDSKEQQSISAISVLIGGPDGHTQAIRDRGDHSVSLSRLTLPHDLAMLFTLETLYRSLSIQANHPYHRE